MLSNWKVVVSARAFWAHGSAATEALRAAGCQVAFTPVSGPLAESDLIEQCQEADAVIASTDPFQEKVFTNCPRLKVVARCGVGIDSVNLAHASAAGVIVTNTPGAMTEAVADYCFALLLGMVRRIPEGSACMKEGGWSEFPGVELPGKTLGLVGLGMIGQAVMRRARGFGMKILAYDPPLVDSGAASNFREVEFVELDRLFAESRFISIHAPNVPETRHLVSTHLLSRMRRDAYLINTSRGALIDEPALIAALREERIAGAALDVYQREPLPADDPLRTTPRLLLTPHNAFNSAEAATCMSDMCAASIIDVRQGRRPQHVCNPQVFESGTRGIS